MNDGERKSVLVPAPLDEAEAAAIRMQWECQRQELLDRVMILELNNENLERIRDRLESERERLRELVTDTRDAMKLLIGMDLHYPWDTIPDEDVDSWIERIQQIKGGGE